MMRIASIVLFVLSMAVLGGWAAMGAHPVTHYQVPMEKTVEDEFGDKTTVTELVDKFEFGMLPDRPWDGAIVWIGLLDGLAVALFAADMVKRKKAA
jgi:hypothetical protein